MGTKAFDKEMFQNLVDYLELLPGDVLRFVFCDGTVAERSFAMEANRNFLLGDRNYPFTHKIKCSHCGAYFTRVRSRRQLIRWSHPKSGKACGVKSLSEEKLKDTSKKVLGLDEFIGEEFMTLVDCICVESSTEVVFHLKNGKVVQRQGNFRNTNPRLSEEQLVARCETLKKARAVLSDVN